MELAKVGFNWTTPYQVRLVIAEASGSIISGTGSTDEDIPTICRLLFNMQG